MNITTNETKAIEFAKQLDPNSTFSSGINWHWMHGFTTMEKAKEFDKFCVDNNLETRGVYSNDKGGGDVRFRD